MERSNSIRGGAMQIKDSPGDSANFPQTQIRKENLSADILGYKMAVASRFCPVLLGSARYLSCSTPYLCFALFSSCFPRFCFVLFCSRIRFHPAFCCVRIRSRVLRVTVWFSILLFCSCSVSCVLLSCVLSGFCPVLFCSVL